MTAPHHHHRHLENKHLPHSKALRPSWLTVPTWSLDPSTGRSLSKDSLHRLSVPYQKCAWLQNISSFLTQGLNKQSAMGDSLPSWQPTPWAVMNITIFLETDPSPPNKCSLRAVASAKTNSLAPDCHEHPLLEPGTILPNRPPP